jgi:hypothetical protein
MDVTAKANGLVSRGRALYLPNIQKSFGLESLPKRFDIEFMYDGDSLTTVRSFDCRAIKHTFVLTYVDISKPTKA